MDKIKMYHATSSDYMFPVHESTLCKLRMMTYPHAYRDQRNNIILEIEERYTIDEEKKTTEFFLAITYMEVENDENE